MALLSKVIWGLFLVLQLLSTARAEADGPDFFSPRPAKNSPVEIFLHRAPQADAPVLSVLPPNVRCLRNLGCQGGLSMLEFTQLTPVQQQERLQQSPRWCRVDAQGVRGWLPAAQLQESGCSFQNPAEYQQRPITWPSQPPLQTTVRGQIRGWQVVDWVLQVRAGQTLTVRPIGKSSRAIFLILPTDGETAWSLDSESGAPFVRRIPADGDLRLRVALMRVHARRMVSAPYALSLSLSGEPLRPIPTQQDALVAGTPFHATARVSCQIEANPLVQDCAAGVIRYDQNHAATLELRWLFGRVEMLRRVLFEGGQPVSSDAPWPWRSSRQEDAMQLELDGEGRFNVPDALLNGG